MNREPDFYGIPVEVIASWCVVSQETASNWKCGVTRPSAQAVKLFHLFYEQRVLDASWRGWAVVGPILIDPEGLRTTQSQLRAYAQVVGYFAEVVRVNRGITAAAAALGVSGGEATENRLRLDAVLPGALVAQGGDVE